MWDRKIIAGMSLLICMIILSGLSITLASPQIDADVPITPTPTSTGGQLSASTSIPEDVWALAWAGVSRNTDWALFEMEFDGVPMVLVPAGCFMMGSEEVYNAQPVHEQCFDEPFWIDKYEVTNAQFAAFEGVARYSSYWTEPNRPREWITWFESQDFCAKRGMRLPTEAEWEYVAGGVESWVYPWGDDWDGEKVIGYWSLSEGTAEVASLPEGASWVGAMDISGNVSEWVSTIYGVYDFGWQEFKSLFKYPYNTEDGRERRNTYDNSATVRVLRGGSSNYSDSLNFRVASRQRSFSYDRNPYVGFRCARSLE